MFSVGASGTAAKFCPCQLLNKMLCRKVSFCKHTNIFEQLNKTENCHPDDNDECSIKIYLIVSVLHNLPGTLNKTVLGLLAALNRSLLKF